MEAAETTGRSTVPEIPYSTFTKVEKQWISLAASYAAMFSMLSSFIYFPAIVPLANDLKVSVQLINLTVTSYLVIAGVAPTFMGDMADHTGRRPVYLLTFVLYVGANIGLANQRSYLALLVLRMVQSAGSSGTYAIAYGVIADIATPAERGSYVGRIILFASAAPSLGPVIGGIITQTVGWRWIFWLLVILSGVHLVTLTLFLPETSRRYVYQGTVHARGINRTLFSLITKGRSRKSEVVVHEHSKRGWHIPNPLACISILFHKGSLCVILIVAIFYTVNATLGASLSAQCIEIYGLNYLEAGLVYLPTGIAGMISSYVTGKLLDRDYRYTAKKCGRQVNLCFGDDITTFPVERARLRSMWYLVFVSVAATIGYGWALHIKTHISVPLIMQFITGFSITSIFTICGTLLTDLNPYKPSTAQASCNLVRCVSGGGGVAALQALINTVGLGWCFTIYGALCALALPILWLLRTRGMAWRLTEVPK